MLAEDDRVGRNGEGDRRVPMSRLRRQKATPLRPSPWSDSSTRVGRPLGDRSVVRLDATSKYRSIWTSVPGSECCLQEYLVELLRSLEAHRGQGPSKMAPVARFKICPPSSV